MKWEVTGAWKADGADASMAVEAPNQRAAESIAAQRGMVVEQCIPQQTPQPPVMGYAPPMATTRPAVQTIQQTSKIWKLVQLVGFFACLGGVVLIALGFNRPSASPGPDAFVVLGALALVGGIFLFCVGRIFAWWFHG